MDGEEADPLRLVALVVAALSSLFLAAVAGVQFSNQGAASALTLPLVLVVPVALGGLWWYVRYR